MILRKIAFCSVLLPATLLATHAFASQTSGDMHWSIINGWKMAVEPEVFVQSLDNKKVFILGKDSNVHIYTIDGTKLGSLPVDEGVVDIAIAPRGEELYLLNANNKSYTAIDISFTQQISIDKAPILGNPDAPVTLVEFSDFECPFCSKVKPLLNELLAANPENLKIAFKHLPLRMHPQAQPAALAAIAAQNQGKFWEMHDALFAIDKVTPEGIEAAAKGIGLDMEQFKKDVASQATAQHLREDMEEAQKAEVTGTPAMFINGVPVKQRSIEAIQGMIDEALNSK